MLLPLSLIFSSRWFSFLLSGLIGWFALLSASTGAQAQIRLGTAKADSSIVATAQVRAELVVLAAQGIVPGQSLTLGLRLEHQPGWHTYWKNAGDSGLPTELQWQLPAGMQAGDIAWPVPKALRVGDLLNYGYEGTVLLPVPATVGADFAPDANGMVDIRLDARWLVCRVECIPQEGTFHLRLPASERHTLSSAEFETAAALQPQQMREAEAIFTVPQPEDGHVLLRVSQLPVAMQQHMLAFFPEDAQTFEHAAILNSADAQNWEDAVWTARLPLSKLRGDTPSQLHFVLALPESGQAWRIAAPVQGLWSAADLTPISPALAAALQANQIPQTAQLSVSAVASSGGIGWLYWGV